MAKMNDKKRKDGNNIEHKKDSSPVQVHIRLKNGNEQSAVYNIFANEKLLHSPNDGRLEPDKWQVFDHIHSANTSNEDVYKCSGYDLVENALKGYNTAVFAYGQQGSGKTRTLMSKDGITAYMVSHLFNRISKHKSLLFNVSCSYLQIYNEHIYDLLNPDNEFECAVREHKTRGLYVENVTCVPCKTPKDVYELINIGRRSLVLAETKLNHSSSRSHAVCQLQIECVEKPARKKNNGVLNTFSPIDELIDEENEAYIDFDTIPFQRKNIKRSHSIAITKMHEKNMTNRNSPPRAPNSEPHSERCNHISHHKHKEDQKRFPKKSHSFRDDCLPSYSKRFNENRYFNVSNMCDVRLSKQTDSEVDEKKEELPIQTGIPVPIRYPSLYHARMEPDPPIVRQYERKKPVSISVQLPRLRRPHGIDDSGVESNTSQSEEDLSDINSDHGGSFYIPDKFETSSDFESDYLNLANNDDAFKSDADKTTKTKCASKGFSTLNSKITIVDLAGSERVKKSHVSGERLKEAQHINLSLLELGNVISALADGKKKHVPYRNSVLTRLLQDTLGGNSKITFLLCVSTKLSDVTETKCTLEFGQKLKKILTNPTLNIDFYKWKYENSLVDQKRMVERKKRKEARRTKTDQFAASTDQIEYNNVMSEYDQSKTLIDMLQYMMGLNEIKSNDKEVDMISTDGDTGAETDDTLTEGSDIDQGLIEDEEEEEEEEEEIDTHNIAFSDISLDDSVIAEQHVEETSVEENTVDFDLFEIPEPIIEAAIMEELSERKLQMHDYELFDDYNENEDENDGENADDINNSRTLEEFLANELACFNDIDDEPPLLTSSPNCTTEGSCSSDETDSITTVSSDSNASKEETIITVNEVVIDAHVDEHIEPVLVSSGDETDPRFDVPPSYPDPYPDPCPDPCPDPTPIDSTDDAHRFASHMTNTEKLNALRQRLRHLCDPRPPYVYLHHIRNGCWCHRLKALKDG